MAAVAKAKSYKLKCDRTYHDENNTHYLPPTDSEGIHASLRVFFCSLYSKFTIKDQLLDQAT